jgi:hypothetical protein
VRRCVIVLVVFMLVLLVRPERALAHGFGQRYDLPVPFWLFLYGAAAAVVLTFFLLVDTKPVPHRYPRFDLLRVGWFQAIFAGRTFLGGLRVVSAALFLLVILSGLFGDQEPTDNLAPTFVWVIWWVGLTFLTAIAGNLWELVNPWKVLFEWTDGLARQFGGGKSLGPYASYPPKWGVWPALGLYFGFVWVELIFLHSSKPFNIAVSALLYSAVTWSGMLIFGKDAWLRSGESFSVFFGILAKFAPTEIRVNDAGICRQCNAGCRTSDGDCVNCYECFTRAKPEDRQLNVRPWAVGLSRPERITADRLAFVIFMLASVTYDGLLVTPLWVQVQTLAAGLIMQVRGVWGIGSLYFVFTLGLIVLSVFFLAAYLGFTKLAQVSSGGATSVGRFAAAYAYTLVPIALAYQIAHYYTFFVIQGQAIVALASDPFGWGWNLFGTADYRVNAGVLSADLVWYSQVALIVVGHVIAVFLAHGIALRLLGDQKRAVRSQYPMLALMVLYTLFSLWILHQPIAVENT